MKVVCDSHIPYIRQGLEALADDVVYMPGSEIRREHLMEADALITRTRTHVCRQLLEGTPVQLVLTATIGHDHIDTRWLDEAGIAWANCPGCNAQSVAQYVHSTVLVLQQQGLLPPRPVIGIVGHGHVGSAVHRWLEPLADRILVSDPPLGMADDLTEADLITFHTPLTTTGPCPTLHMASVPFFATLKRQPVIVNSARGGVVDETALLQAMDKGLVRAAVIDTWEGEPQINPELLRRAMIATPHIAGYSADGKANASRMVLEALARHFSLPFNTLIAPPELPAGTVLPAEPVARALALYNPLDDSARLKASPSTFEAQRSHYPLRREAATSGK